MTIEQQLIVVPTDACVDRPVLQANLVLDKERLLEIRPVAEKREIYGRVVIELVRIRDVITQVLMQEHVVGFESELKLMPPMIDSCRAPEVRLAKVVVLKDFNRR